jgi:histidinol dehydrogenase
MATPSAYLTFTRVAAKVWKEAFPYSHARNQGRRPPRIDGPPHGTAIWLLLRVTDRWDVLGCHKVACTTVGSPHLGPSMRGFESGS